MSDNDHKDVNESALTRHNELRKLHGAAPLYIDWELAKAAQKHADELAKTNKFAHSKNDGKYGENIANAFNSMEGYVYTGAQATQDWYDEVKDYKFGEEKQIGNIDHFSQIVWKETNCAGFGRAKTKKGSFIIVGQYKPPGNISGRFKDNVGAATGKPTPLPAVPCASQPSREASKQSCERLSPKIEPKSSKDMLIKQSTKTKREGTTKTIVITETYKTPSGSTYDQVKTIVEKVE